MKSIPNGPDDATRIVWAVFTAPSRVIIISRRRDPMI